jgi:hypothetical protein
MNPAGIIPSGEMTKNKPRILGVTLTVYFVVALKKGAPAAEHSLRARLQVLLHARMRAHQRPNDLAQCAA